MVVVALLVAGVLVMLVALLVWWRGSAGRRALVRNGVSEQEARENAAPLTTAILSGSRARAHSETPEGDAPASPHSLRSAQ
jgi:hypothetical protein